jgi:hypothetical protein
MARLVEDLAAAIAAAFETDEYRNRHREIEAELAERQERALGELGERARAEGIALVRTPSGFGFGPFSKAGDGVMEPEEFGKLRGEGAGSATQEAIAQLQKELGDVLHQMPKWRREAHDKHARPRPRGDARGGQQPDRRAEGGAYAGAARVQEYLERVKQDTLENAAAFRQAKDGEPPTLFGIPLPRPEGSEGPFRRYAVNVLIAHGRTQGAPVVYEDHPSHAALLGRIEHVAQMGALVTDFTLIRAGALHRANGGYLVLDALKVLTQPYAWEALKRALRSRDRGRAHARPGARDDQHRVARARADPARRQGGAGGRADPLLPAARLGPGVRRAVQGGGRLRGGHAARRGRRRALRAPHRRLRAAARSCGRWTAAAVARVIEQQARDAGDAHKLSVRMQTLADLLREADYWAGPRAAGGRRGRRAAGDRRAVARSDRLRERLQRAHRARQPAHRHRRRAPSRRRTASR